MTYLIEIDNLTWWYPKSPYLIFKWFNLRVKQGDFIFITWESWKWKTTLARLLIRDLKPPKKSIFFNKEDISRFSNKEVQIYRRKIWMIFQDYKLIDRKTVEENIAYPLEILWLKKEIINKKVNEILYKLDMMDKKSEKIPNLSWWEKQRVAIARALVKQPQFIIADEPTWNLDWENTKKIADIFIDLNLQWNTVLFITHDLKLLEYINQKIKADIVNI